MIKSFEKLNRKEILQEMEHNDPLHFAYRPCRGVEEEAVV